MAETLGIGFSELANIAVALGTLFFLRHVLQRRRQQQAESADPVAAWIQTQATLLEALAPFGFIRSDENANSTRLLFERSGQSVSLTWDSRHREVAVRVADSRELAISAELFTARMPRHGAADREIAVLVAGVQSRVSGLASVLPA